MKRPVLIAMLPLAVLALGVSPAAGAGVVLATRDGASALPMTASIDQSTLQLYYVERCGQRVSPLFG